MPEAARGMLDPAGEGEAEQEEEFYESLDRILSSSCSSTSASASASSSRTSPGADGPTGRDSAVARTYRRTPVLWGPPFSLLSSFIFQISFKFVR